MGRVLARLGVAFALVCAFFSVLMLWDLGAEPQPRVEVAGSGQMPAAHPWMISTYVPGERLYEPVLLPRPESAEANSNAAAVQARLIARSRESGLFVRTEDIASARQQPDLFRLVDEQKVAQQLTGAMRRSQHPGRLFLEYDFRTLESRVEGDEVSLLLPGLGHAVKARVDEVTVVGPFTRWTGAIEDLQGGGRFTVTHATRDRYATGTVDTAFGSYALEVNQGYGWVADQRAEFVIPPEGDALPAPPEPPAK